MAKGKGHFGPTDRNDQTGHCGPPSKLVPNIPVGPNRNGPFHLMNQPKFPEFWVNGKHPSISRLSWMDGVALAKPRLRASQRCVVVVPSGLSSQAPSMPG